MIRGHCRTCGLWVPVAIACSVCSEEHCYAHAGKHVELHFQKKDLFFAAHAANERNKIEAAAGRKLNV